MAPTRWGICSAGKISNDFCAALLTLPSDQHQLVAVAARKLEDAQQFAKRFNIPAAYGSYEELAKDDNVEVVYIGTIHPYHYTVARLFLSYNRHILCEKPLTLSLRDTQELLAEATSRGLFFMEGYWSRLFPVHEHVRQLLRDGALGEVKQVVANICLPLDGVERIRQKALGGGGLMDIGCYAVQALNMVFPGKPDQILATGTLYEEGVDEGGCIALKYPGGRLASLCYHTATRQGSSQLKILGSKDYVTIHDPFWCPNTLTTSSGTREFPFPPCDESAFYFHNSIGFVYELQAVRDCLQKGQKECPAIPHKDTEAIMYILDQVLQQLGVSYDQP